MKKACFSIILFMLCFCMVGSSVLAPISLFAEEAGEQESAPTFDTSTPVWLYDFSTKDIYKTFYDVARMTYTHSEEGYTTFTAEDDDPNLYLAVPTLPINQFKYMVVSQRTTASRKGEFYVNRSDNKTMGAAGTHVQYDLVPSGDWETILTPCTAWADAPDDVRFTAVRFDPIELNVLKGESIDIQYAAFFASEEDAKAFNFTEYKAKLSYEKELADREEFGDPNDSSMPVHIYDFSSKKIEVQMGGGNNVSYAFSDDGYITFTASGDDPSMTLTPPPVPLAKLQYAVIYQRTTSQRQGEFYVDRSDGKKMGEEGTNVKYTLDSSGEWGTLIAPCTAWADVEESVNILNFRYDPIQLNVTAGETIDVKYVAFFETEKEAKQFKYDIYLKKVAEQEQEKEESNKESLEVNWPDPTYKDKETVPADTHAGTLTYKTSDDGKTVTISYDVNGETRTFTVPNTNQYKSGPFAATDDLGRSLYDAGDVGVIGDNGQHYVGLFYFLWHGEHGDPGIYDINKTLMSGGDITSGSSGLYGQVNDWNWFAEPLYGYYYAKDTWVVRKHLELLCNIGIDFLFFDTTNYSTYSYNALNLMEILHQLNEEGYDAPEVVFYTNTDAVTRVKQIYDRIYAQNLYPDTWLMIDGKPVIIAPEEANINDFFTIKLNQWPNVEEHLDNAWPWIDFTFPQRIYNDADGKPSAISVSVAQHSGTVVFSDSQLYGDYTNRGRSFNGPSLREKYLKDSYNAWKADNSLTNQGINFQSQWDQAHKADVEFVLVTGWNEWIATRQDGVKYYDDADRVVFVDTFSPEYSRDIEMMKGGYFDNYYIQLAYNIQKLKGTAPTVVQDSRKPINVTGEFDQWEDVTVTYTDPTGDAQHRDALGFGQTVYKNETGKNDIVASKITNDTKYLYVYSQNAYDVSMFDPNASWMQLYLNTDGEATGWYGYDYIINYKAKDAFATTVAKYNGTDGAYGFESVGEVSYRAKGNRLMIQIPLEMLGYGDYEQIYFEFKWADSTSTINTMEQFYTDGDCAPLGRLNYIYQTYIPGVSIPTEKDTIPQETQSEVEPVTEADVNDTSADNTTADTTTDEGGCASVAGGMVFVMMSVIAGSVMLLKKKQD